MFTKNTYQMNLLVLFFMFFSSIFIYSQEVVPIGGIDVHLWKKGNTVNIHWTEGYLTGNVKVELIDCSRQQIYIVDSSTSSYSVNYTIPSSLTIGDNFRIKITSLNDNSKFLISKTYFPIVDSQLLEKNNFDNNNFINNNIVTEDKLFIYPNPVNSNSVLNIDLNGQQLSLNFTIRIFDVMGNSIVEPINYSNYKRNIISIPINDISSGIYFIELSDGIGKFIKKIIVVNN